MFLHGLVNAIRLFEEKFECSNKQAGEAQIQPMAWEFYCLVATTAVHSQQNNLLNNF